MFDYALIDARRKFHNKLLRVELRSNGPSLSFEVASFHVYHLNEWLIAFDPVSWHNSVAKIIVVPIFRFHFRRVI